MTGEDFIPIAADMQARWWSFPIPAAALDQFVSDLADLPAAKVAAAVEVHAAAGADRPPTTGQVRRLIAEMELDAPTWEQARTALVRWRRGREARQEALADWSCPHDECDGSRWIEVGENSARPCRCREGYQERLKGYGELPVLVAEFVQDGHTSGGEITKLIDGDSTVEAQVRSRWEQFVRRIVSSRTLAGLPASAELPRIEAAREEDDGRHIRGGAPRRGDLHRFDPLALIEQAA